MSMIPVDVVWKAGRPSHPRFSLPRNDTLLPPSCYRSAAPGRRTVRGLTPAVSDFVKCHYHPSAAEARPEAGAVCGCQVPV